VPANGSGAGRSRGGSWRATGAAPEVVPEERDGCRYRRGDRDWRCVSHRSGSGATGAGGGACAAGFAPLLSSSSDTHSCWGYFGPTGWTNPGEHVI